MNHGDKGAAEHQPSKGGNDLQTAPRPETRARTGGPSGFNEDSALSRIYARHAPLIIGTLATALLISGLAFWFWQTRNSRLQALEKIVDHSFSLIESAEHSTVSSWAKVLALSDRYEDALDVATRFEPHDRARLFRDIALYLVIRSDAQDPESAAATIQAATATAEKAVEAALEVGDARSRYDLLLELLKTFAKRKLGPAEVAADESLALAPTLDSPTNQKKLLVLMQHLVRLGMAQKASAAAKSFDDPALRCFALVGLADGYHRIVDSEQAQEAAAEALFAAREIGHEETRTRTLAYKAVAWLYVGVGHEKAIDVDTARKVADLITQSRDRDEVLERVAWRKSKDSQIDLQEALGIKDQVEDTATQYAVLGHSIPVLYHDDLTQLLSTAIWKALLQAFTTGSKGIPAELIDALEEAVREFSSPQAVSEAIAVAKRIEDPLLRYEAHFDLLKILDGSALPENKLLTWGRNKLCGLPPSTNETLTQVLDSVCMSRSVVLAQALARSAASDIPQEERRNEALTELAKHLVTHGQVSAAFDIALSVPDKKYLLADLTESLKRLGRTDDALESLAKIYADSQETESLQKVAFEMMAVARAYHVLDDSKATTVRNLCRVLAEERGDSTAIAACQGRLEPVDEFVADVPRTEGAAAVDARLRDVERLARSGDYQKARLVALDLSSHDHTLDAYVRILLEFAMKNNPELAKKS